MRTRLHYPRAFLGRFLIRFRSFLTRTCGWETTRPKIERQNLLVHKHQQSTTYQEISIEISRITSKRSINWYLLSKELLYTSYLIEFRSIVRSYTSVVHEVDFSYIKLLRYVWLFIVKFNASSIWRWWLRIINLIFVKVVANSVHLDIDLYYA